MGVSLATDHGAVAPRRGCTGCRMGSVGGGAAGGALGRAGRRCAGSAGTSGAGAAASSRHVDEMLLAPSPQAAPYLRQCRGVPPPAPTAQSPLLRGDGPGRRTAATPKRGRACSVRRPGPGDVPSARRAAAGGFERVRRPSAAAGTSRKGRHGSARMRTHLTAPPAPGGLPEPPPRPALVALVGLGGAPLAPPLIPAHFPPLYYARSVPC